VDLLLRPLKRESLVKERGVKLWKGKEENVKR
jgi:hypothetical protein